MALIRDINILEWLRLQGRAEATNVFNLVSHGQAKWTADGKSLMLIASYPKLGRSSS